MIRNQDSLPFEPNVGSNLKNQNMKLINWIAFLLVIIINTKCHAQFSVSGNFSNTVSFESGVPATWVASGGGDLSTYTGRFKHGSKSLKWNWNSLSSKITVTDPLLISNCTSTNSGIKFWIYSEQLTQDNVEFVFYDASNRVLCRFNYKLDFVGWRTQWIDYTYDLGKSKSAVIQRLEINAPDSVSNGSLWFDLFDYPTVIEWDRAASEQFNKPIQRNPAIVPDIYQRIRTNQLRYPEPKIAVKPTSITASMISDVNSIEQRMEDFLLGSGTYASDPIYMSRLSSINSGLSNVHNTFLKLNIVNNAGVLSGVPIFGIMSRSSFPYGPNVESVVSLAFNLAMDYRLNGNNQSRLDFIQLIDYLYDQGWADGSSLGSLYFIETNTQDFARACFLMRNELDNEPWGNGTKLDRTIKTIFWYSDGSGLFADVDDPILVTSDDLYRGNPQTFWTFFMMKDTDINKYWYLDQFIKRYEQVILKPVNSFGMPGRVINPDYIGYHHFGPALSTYFTNGIHAAMNGANFVSGTQYEYNLEVKETFKQCALVIREISQQFDFPKGMSQRWTGWKYGAGQTTKLLSAASYASSSLNQPDKDLTAAFFRLWGHPQSNTNNWYLGDMETALSLVKNSNIAAEQLSGVKSYPFASLMSFRKDNWLVSMKGYSKYVWNTENCCSRNIHGGYDSHGQMSIMKEDNTTSSYEASGILHDKGYHWNYVPGATTVDLSFATLAGFTGWSKQESSFAGGVDHKNQAGIWSMNLIDETNIIGFKAKKSVFFFGGNQLVALGSNITNKASDITVTTLFQSKTDDANPQNQPINVNGAVVTTFPYTNTSLTGSATIADPYGNTYYIPQSTDIELKRANQNSVNINTPTATNGNWSTAFFNHGISPVNKSYEYAVLVQTSAAQVSNFVASVPYVVLENSDKSHIVKYLPDNQTGYAVFDVTASLNESTGYLKGVSVPLMMMIEEVTVDHLEVTVADPDLIPNGQTSSFELRGKWNVLNSLPELVSAVKNNDTTIFTLNHKDGKSCYLNLEREKSLSVMTETLDNTQVKIYPNPSTGKFTITGSIGELDKMAIYNTLGQVIFDYGKISKKDGTEIDIDLSILSTGIYLVKTKTATQKIYKQ
jgi:chondroitin-sulfate-ABC endolyase/exolyase